MQYGSIASLTARQIADKGRAITLVYKSPGVYSPGSDSVVGGSTETVEVSAVFSNYQESQIDGSFVRIGDKRALIAANDLDDVPKTNDEIIDGENLYKIVNVKEIAPGDTVVLYELQLRG